MSTPGEDRWKTKMLMTEHQEQYDQHGKTPSQQPMAEEFKMLRDYILLPHMLTMVQRSIDDLQYHKGILKELFRAATEQIAIQISQDMHRLRKELAGRNIRISPAELEDIVMNYHYTCRGYSGTFGITREECKAQISIGLGNYITELLQKMKQNR